MGQRQYSRRMAALRDGWIGGDEYFLSMVIFIFVDLIWQLYFPKYFIFLKRKTNYFFFKKIKII